MCFRQLAARLVPCVFVACVSLGAAGENLAYERTMADGAQIRVEVARRELQPGQIERDGTTTLTYTVRMKRSAESKPITIATLFDTAVLGASGAPIASLRCLDIGVWELGTGLLVLHDKSDRESLFKDVYVYLFSSAENGDVSMTSFAKVFSLGSMRAPRKTIQRASLLPSPNGAYLLFQFTDTTAELWYWNPCSSSDSGARSTSKCIQVWQGKESELLEGKGKLPEERAAKDR